jgi:hypothetical protein
MSARLVEHSLGRVVLHVACLLRDGKVRWHWAGIRRELRSASSALHSMAL